ncbi:hypothetical protein LEQ04_00125 [Riemerella anatipestifer]|nr:hypothetical protein LEQ03_11000 [Riemerella anatipestifer]WPC15444.1 hypothetical protein LEQ04_00125 [Riemerella anatipestifer]
MHNEFKNTKSLNAVLEFLKNNEQTEDNIVRNDFNKNAGDGITGSSSINHNRCVTVIQSISKGLNEKSIIRNDRIVCDTFTKWGSMLTKIKQEIERLMQFNPFTLV